MRDPNEITSADRERWLRSTLASLKKLTEPPGSKPQSQALGMPAGSRNLSDTAKPAVLPQRQPVGGKIEFNEKRTVRGVEDSPKFRRKFEKQLRKDVKSLAGRESLVKSFVENAGSSGRMSARGAKRAILASHSAGQISRREVRSLIKRLGV